MKIAPMITALGAVSAVAVVGVMGCSSFQYLLKHSSRAYQRKQLSWKLKAPKPAAIAAHVAF